MMRKSEQFAGGALSGNGRGVEVCADRRGLPQDAPKFALGRAQSRDPGAVEVPGRGKATASGVPSTTNCAESRMCERHYSVAEVAELWNLSASAVRKIFQNELGVFALGEPRPKFGRRRGKVTLRIPQSILERVYRRQCIGALMES